MHERGTGDTAAADSQVLEQTLCLLTLVLGAAQRYVNGGVGCMRTVARWIGAMIALFAVMLLICDLLLVFDLFIIETHDDS